MALKWHLSINLIRWSLRSQRSSYPYHPCDATSTTTNPSRATIRVGRFAAGSVAVLALHGG